MTVIGYIGLGDIGEPMARRALQAGHELVVWNRTRAKADALLAEGAGWADTPRELATHCDIIGMCLTSHKAVGEVVEGPDGLFAATARATRRVIVDFSTGAPEVARQRGEEGDRINIGWVDSPVSGGVPAATEGRLTLFMGGRAEDVEFAAPLIDAVAGRKTHMGPNGAGQTTKLCNQIICGTAMFAIAEAIAVGRKAGIDVARLPEALKGGFADSGPLQVFGPRMAAHNFEPRIGSSALMAKDMNLGTALAAANGVPARLAPFIADLFRQVGELPSVSLEDDVSSIVKLFEPD
jgi:3-hydroxyisobutyrate dehydrogenase